MSRDQQVICPVCQHHDMMLKYEVTYEYSYVIDANAPGRCNTSEFLPYLYDNREQKEARQYIKCRSCGTKYPCYLEEWQQGIRAETMQKAIDAAYSAKQHNNGS